MGRLEKIELEKKIILPELYRRFYLHCSAHIPVSLVGTDTINTIPDLNEFAVELLTEDEVENFLNNDDFVFMMHQGYMFWYFKADGNPDPIVYGYYEGKKKPDKLGELSVFLRGYIK